MTKKTYEVTGAHPVHDTKPGGTFTAALPPQQERALIDGGAIRVRREPKPDVEGVTRVRRGAVKPVDDED